MKLIRTLGLGALLGSALAAPAHAFDLLQALQAARQYDAGYASASAFSAMVRRSVGMPPSRFFASA